MPWRGLALALAAACAHTGIDTARKFASASIPSDQLVVLVYLLDAIIALAGVGAAGGFQGLTFHNPGGLAAVVATSSALLFLAKFLYQRALRASPLSLTIPYLSFTPAILVGTAFVLLGETPSFCGLCGVAVVTCGGYLLSQQGAATAPAAAKSGSAGVVPHGPHHPHHHAVLVSGYSPAVAAELESAAAAAARTLLRSSSSCSSLARPGGLTGHPHSAASADDLAVDVTEPKCYDTKQQAAATAAAAFGVGGALPWLPSHSRQHHLSSHTATLSHSSSTGHIDGLGQLQRPARHASAASDSSFPHAAPPGAPRIGGRLAERLLALVVASPLGALTREPGTLMMLGVAALWSMTASLDKLGVLEAPSVAVYCAVQRATIGAASLVHILVLGSLRESAAVMRRHFWLLLSISVMELAAVALFLAAVQFLLVSYVVAIKRSSILLSVLSGRLLFRESIARRLPYVLLMLCGMTLIVIEPDASDVHHAHSAHNR